MPVFEISMLETNLNFLLLTKKILIKPEELSLASFSEINWPKYTSYLEQHKVLSRVLNNLSQSLPDFALPNELLLKQQARSAFRMLLEHEQQKLLEIFVSKAVPVIALKGPVLAQELYGNAEIYDSGDIDFLVKLSDLAQVKAILREQAYCECQELPKAWEAYNQSIVHASEFKHAASGISVDLHWHLAETFWAAQSFTDSAWRSSIDIELAGQKIKSLDVAHSFIFLALQAYKESGQVLGRLYDLYIFFNQQSFDLEEIRALAEQHNLWPVVEYTLKEARTCFDQDDYQPKQISEFKLLWLSRNNFKEHMLALYYRYVLPFGPDLAEPSMLAFARKPLRVLLLALSQIVKIVLGKR